MDPRYLLLPLTTRPWSGSPARSPAVRRLERREALRREGGSVDDTSTSEFLAWARGYDDPSFPSRSRRSHEAWLETLRKPVLRQESSQPVDELCRRVLGWQPHI